MNSSKSLDRKNIGVNECADKSLPFESWPWGGLPEGYFQMPMSYAATAFYKENGWLVIDGAFSMDEVKRLLHETSTICRNQDGLIEGIAPAPQGMDDMEAIKRVLCIHFPHKISDIFRGILAHPIITDVLRAIIGSNVKCMQSMLFVKSSGKSGQAWHQDEDFIPTRDRSLVGAWIALDDATVENGCLWILSKSHKRGILWPQKFHFDTRFDCTRESFDFPWKDEDAIPVEVKAGSVVFFNGYTLHKSLPNTAKQGFRRSLVNHYMSAESLLPWHKPDEKTSMALADYRDIVLVSGEDPFGYKGTVDLAKAFVRGAGKGGCADWTDEEQKELASKQVRKDQGVKM